MLHLSGDEFEKRKLINDILASTLSCGCFDVRESTSARSLPRRELEALSAILKLVELMAVQDPTFGAEAFLKLRNNGHALLHSDKYPLALMPDGGPNERYRLHHLGGFDTIAASTGTGRLCVRWRVLRARSNVRRSGGLAGRRG